MADFHPQSAELVRAAIEDRIARLFGRESEAPAAAEVPALDAAGLPATALAGEAVEDAPGDPARTAMLRGDYPPDLQADLVALLTNPDVNTHPRDVEGALAMLQGVAGVFDAHSHPGGIFPSIYGGIVTRNVAAEVDRSKEQISASGTTDGFLGPDRLSSQAGIFAQLYVDALKAKLGLPTTEAAKKNGAWQQAFAFDNWAAASGSQQIPLMHFVLGMGAHIRTDLAAGIYQNFVERGEVNNGGAMEDMLHDHHHIAEILEASTPETVELLDRKYGCPATDLAIRTGLLGKGSDVTQEAIGLWRDEAWDDFLAMMDVAHGKTDRLEPDAKETADREYAAAASDGLSEQELDAWVTRQVGGITESKVDQTENVGVMMMLGYPWASAYLREFERQNGPRSRE